MHRDYGEREEERMSDDSKVVVDTNVFVGAGFNDQSDSARVVQAVRDGRLRMPWTSATREEVRNILRKIPPLSWGDVEGLFRNEDEVKDPPEEGGLGWVTDPPDRKFAALARATDAHLVSNDDDVLANRSAAGFPVMTPSEYAGERL